MRYTVKQNGSRWQIIDGQTRQPYSEKNGRRTETEWGNPIAAQGRCDALNLAYETGQPLRIEPCKSTRYALI